jgi:hypothetical protein
MVYLGSCNDTASLAARIRCTYWIFVNILDPYITGTQSTEVYLNHEYTRKWHELGIIIVQRSTDETNHCFGFHDE